MKNTLILTMAILMTSISATASYVSEIEAYRKTSETNLRGEDSWLAVVGLFWLKDGANQMGSAFGSHIRLPNSLSKKLGTISKNGETVSVTFKEIKDVKVDGKNVEVGKSYELKNDGEENTTVVNIGSVKFFIIKRANGLGVRVKDPQSEARLTFPGKNWYVIDPKLRIEAKWEVFDPPKKIIIPDILGNENSEESPGEASFEINGEKVSLVPTKEGDKLFFVFRDKSSDTQSYSAGRFLTTDGPKDGKVILDFNKAVNPPCAFTDYATCPRPPKENNLKVRIFAGEKAPMDKHPKK